MWNRRLGKAKYKRRNANNNKKRFKVQNYNVMVTRLMIIWFSTWSSMWSSIWSNIWPTNLIFLKANKLYLHLYQTLHHYCHSHSKPLLLLTYYFCSKASSLLLLLLMLFISKSLISANQAPKLTLQLILSTNAFLHPTNEREN